MDNTKTKNPAIPSEEVIGIAIAQVHADGDFTGNVDHDLIEIANVLENMGHTLDGATYADTNRNIEDFAEIALELLGVYYDENGYPANLIATYYHEEGGDDGGL